MKVRVLNVNPTNNSTITQDTGYSHVLCLLFCLMFRPLLILQVRNEAKNSNGFLLYMPKMTIVIM